MAELTTPAARVLALLAVTPGADTELAHAWEIPAEELRSYLASVPSLTVDQVVDASDVLDAPAAFLACQEDASLTVALRIGLEHFRGSITLCRTAPDRTPGNHHRLETP